MSPFDTHNDRVRKKTWGEVIDTMRNTLASPASKAEGTSTQVIISGSSMGVIEIPEDFIKSCIDEVEKLEVKRLLGEPVSQLEKLGLEFLLHASYQGALLYKK